MENENQTMQQDQQEPQYVPLNAHSAIIAELVEQRDKALADCANKGMENRLLRAQLSEQQPAEVEEATIVQDDEQE